MARDDLSQRPEIVLPASGFTNYIETYDLGSEDMVLWWSRKKMGGLALYRAAVMSARSGEHPWVTVSAMDEDGEWFMSEEGMLQLEGGAFSPQDELVISQLVRRFGPRFTDGTNLAGASEPAESYWMPPPEVPATRTFRRPDDE